MSNRIPLGDWLTVLANLAVVAGIIFVAVEVRQNTQMMQAQINQSRTESAMSEQQALFNSDYMPAILVKVGRGEDLTPDEMVRFEPYLRGFSRNMDNQLWQHRNGLLGENIPRSVRDAVRTVIGGSAVAMEVWDRQKVGFTDEYVTFVEEAIADLR
jgi:hypothetical protein